MFIRKRAARGSQACHPETSGLVTQEVTCQSFFLTLREEERGGRRHKAYRKPLGRNYTCGHDFVPVVFVSKRTVVWLMCK